MGFNFLVISVFVGQEQKPKGKNQTRQREREKSIRNFVFSCIGKERVKLDSYIIAPRLGGLVIHDQRKTSNLIQNRHRHTDKTGTMIMIHPHSIVRVS